MTSYLLRATHAVNLPPEVRPSPQEVTDWLERTIGYPGVEVTRVGETALEFRSRSGLVDGQRAKDSVAFLANGEIQVDPGPRGLVITLRANPHIWYGLIPIVQLVMLVGWANATGFLRWGAGLGELVLGAIFIFLTWGSLHSFLAYKAD